MTSEQLKIIQQLAEIGDVILISNGNRINLDKNAKVPLKTQLDAVLYFLQRLDIGMLKIILEEGRTYQDFKKSLFIKKLGNALDEFTANGNNYLNRYEGYCNSESCNFKCKGYSFIGNKTDHYFDLIIDVKKGIIQDIYECTSFNNSIKDENRKYRIEINTDNVPF